MNKLFLDQGGYIELLKSIRRLYEKTNKEFADTNTAYTLSLEGNNLKLTPSSGEAQTIDLSSLIKSIAGDDTDTGVYGGRFSVKTDAVENIVSGTGEGDMGYATYTYAIPTLISDIRILNVTMWNTSWAKISDADLKDGITYNIESISIDDSNKQIIITTQPNTSTLLTDFYINFTYTKTSSGSTYV